MKSTLATAVFASLMFAIGATLGIVTAKPKAVTSADILWRKGDIGITLPDPAGPCSGKGQFDAMINRSRLIGCATPYALDTRAGFFSIEWADGTKTHMNAY